MNTTAVMNAPVIAATVSQPENSQNGADAAFEKLLLSFLGTVAVKSEQQSETSGGQISPEDAAKLILDVLTGKLSPQSCAEALSLSETDSQALVNALETLVSELLAADASANSNESPAAAADTVLSVSAKKSDEADASMLSETEELSEEAAALVLELLTYFQSNTQTSAENVQQTVQKIIQMIISAPFDEAKEQTFASSGTSQTEKAESVKLPEALSRLNELITEIRKSEGQQTVAVSVESEGTAKGQDDGVKSTIFSMKIIHRMSELEELTAAASFNLSEVQRTVGEASSPVEQAPVEEQITQFISEKLIEAVSENSTTKLTMTLKPETLGELSIEIVKKGTELTVIIAAKEALTQKLIEEKLPMLMTSLNTNENELKSIQVISAQENQDASLHQQYSSQDFSQNQSRQFSNSRTESGTVISSDKQTASEISEQAFEKEGM
ncbi:MAG: flagellar hook-length control protein FliK, partial [Oscillospiraceae bacterium]